MKVGLFSSPQGYETLDPSTNPFYSHSYTYNYAVTFNHTGILTRRPTSTTRLTCGSASTPATRRPSAVAIPTIRSPASSVIGLNHLFNDKLTVLALSHIGPENNFNVDPNAGKDLRYYNDAVFTYKINDDWTSVDRAQLHLRRIR